MKGNAFIYSLLSYTKTPHWPAYTIVLKLKGKYYYYDTTPQNIDETIKISEELINNKHCYTAYNLHVLKKLKIDIKKVRRCIKLGLLEERDFGLVYRTKKEEPLANTQFGRYRLRRKFYNKPTGLKQDSRKKQYKRRMKKHSYRGYQQGRKPSDWIHEDRTSPFENMSSNVFGHPKKKFSLKIKKLQKGYRRPAEKEEMIKDETIS